MTTGCAKKHEGNIGLLVVDDLSCHDPEIILVVMVSLDFFKSVPFDGAEDLLLVLTEMSQTVGVLTVAKEMCLHLTASAHKEMGEVTGED